jgi:hypothetical protein
MSEPHAPVTTRHQVLADPTGRRRRRLVIAGRFATTALGLWLVVLVLGGLVLEPLAGLPIVGDLGAREAAPPALPKRIQGAIAEHTTVAPAAVARNPVRSVPAPPRRPATTTPSRGKTRSPRTKPATPAGPITGRGLPSSSLAPSSPTTSPSAAAPGQTRIPPGQATTKPAAPGQTRIPPGQTTTEPGPPAGTPGTTHGASGNTRGLGTVTTP